jgi:hypothetical protein
LGKLSDGGLQLFWRYHPGHKTKLKRFCSLYLTPRQRKLARSSHPDQTRQQPGSPEVKGKSALHERFGKSGSIRGNHDVAPNGQIHPRANRNPVDGGNGRFRQPVQRRGSPPWSPHVFPAYGRASQIIELVKIEVGARAEVITRPPNDKNSLVRVGEVLKRIRKLWPTRCRHSVLARWLAQRQPADLAHIRHQHKPSVVVHRQENNGRLRCAPWVSILFASKTRQ